MVGLNSFPSGHATSAFAVFTCLVLLSNNQFLKFVFFVLALTSAFSRTYLSQHWLVDITFGSIIGTVTATLFYFIFELANRQHSKTIYIFWLCRSLLWLRFWQTGNWHKAFFFV